MILCEKHPLRKEESYIILIYSDNEISYEKLSWNMLVTLKDTNERATFDY